MSLRVLIIDNYDSYTFNLYQYLTLDQVPTVIRNDQFTWDEFQADVLPFFDAIVISPGKNVFIKDLDVLTRGLILEYVAW